MEGDAKIIRLTKVFYYTWEVVEFLGESKSLFEEEIKPHRERLGPKSGKRWSSSQVKNILYILAPHCTVVIE